ncbi:MAG: PilZ domain-containing protein [bacterium]
MRQFIRHPSDVPIEYRLVDVANHTQDYLRNISTGGLCFSSRVDIPVGAEILIQIPLRKPVFEVKGVVTWCQPVEDHFEVGVKFIDTRTELGMRMAEQVCYIEHYKKEIFEKDGRLLTGEEAAVEWIATYAQDFPS